MGKYCPCPIDELEARPSLINEPLPPDNVITLRKARSLRAVLAENLNATRALLRQLEDGVVIIQCRTQCRPGGKLILGVSHIRNTGSRPTSSVISSGARGSGHGPRPWGPECRAGGVDREHIPDRVRPTSWAKSHLAACAQAGSTKTAVPLVRPLVRLDRLPVERVLLVRLP